ncbi:hypothetical protein ZYGM_003318 [Zygosaccharomyces mellis]|uniref:Receptor L-domain domain-containing protein n=1 Tax=Zygosaccharomyces mellis TaxID=42258 RepID=A0A4C2ECY7_9SACH|nr:hypothetical protein ZYGM_003318 [Zygosaccharomyces mellis]
MKHGLAFLLSLFVASTFAKLDIQRQRLSAAEEFGTFGGGKGPRLPHNVRPHANFLNNKRGLSELCRKDHHFIEASGDLRTLGLQCGNISGSVTLSNYQESVVDFGEIENIGGSLIIEDSSSIVKIQGRRLKKISGVFFIKNLTSLVAIELPELKYVNAIEWKVVPILTNAHLDDHVEGLTSITISDSSLATINGFQKVDELGILDINNNRFLERINTNVKKVTKELRVHANAKELELELPELKSARNITIRDTSSIELPKLEKVDNSLEFIENQVSSLLLSNLRSIGGTLGIMQNNQLSNLDFGNVTDVNGGLVIANNTNLEKIDFLQQLKQIGGAIYFEGKFQDTDFPQLKLVKGSAFIKSNSVVLDCNKWITPLHGRAIIRGGKLLCISGRKQKTQNISQDGEVLDESEAGSNEQNGKDGGKGKNGVLSKITSSSSSIFDNVNIVWIVGITWVLCLIHTFHLG